MFIRSFLLLIPMLLTSCGYRKWWGHSESQRKMASTSMQQLLKEDDQSSEQRLIEKLTSIHYYTMIGHKNLREFDQILEYESIPYHNLMATKIQLDELQNSLKGEFEELARLRDQKKIENFKSTLVKFAGLSKLHQISLENLFDQMNLKDLIPLVEIEITAKDTEDHYKELGQLTDFQIHEKIIDHLSHMIDLKYETDEKRFAPSMNKSGNITGHEFPQKIWSLTFNGALGIKTRAIVKELQKFKVHASFFPEVPALAKKSSESQALLTSSMELGAYSWSSRDLTKVGNLTLQKEISDAIIKVSEHKKAPVELYRLPYGAGMNASHIRERIAQSETIHVFWTVDALDWMPQSARKIADRTLKLMQKSSKDSGIILFHETSERTELSLPEVLNYLKKDGRRVCTVGSVIQIINQGEPNLCH